MHILLCKFNLASFYMYNTEAFYLDFILFSLFQLKLLLIIGSNKGHSLKLIPELESLWFIYPKKCIVHYCMQHTPILDCTNSNFKFRAIAKKKARTFGRDPPIMLA